MSLPKPPVEVPVNADLQTLAPTFRACVGLVCADMVAWGYTPRVFETLRTDDRQRFLYGFGREYDDGRGVVTNSRTAMDTWHGFGLAVDIVDRAKLWNAPDDFWWVLGTSARRHGLVWGADWNGNWSSADERFMDRPHIQWGNGMRRRPSALAVELLRTRGLAAVWAEVGAA